MIVSRMINLQLNEIAARGADSRIVYVTATNSPEAFCAGGPVLSERKFTDSESKCKTE